MSGQAEDHIKVTVSIEFNTADDVQYTAIGSFESILQAGETREEHVDQLAFISLRSAILEAYAEEHLLDQPEFLREATIEPTEFDSTNMPEPERDRSGDEKAFTYSEADELLGEKHGSGLVIEEEST